jgi:hemerythrin-like metal-binding protein
MRNFRFSGALAVGVPEIDEEHHLLFELCDRLERAAAVSAAPDEVRPILDELIARAAAHFSHEERQMRCARYAHYAWHRRQHRAASARVIALDRHIRRGDAGALRELLEFLAGWLPDHIGIADRMLGAFLRNRARAHACVAGC